MHFTLSCLTVCLFVLPNNPYPVLGYLIDYYLVLPCIIRYHLMLSYIVMLYYILI